MYIVYCNSQLVLYQYCQCCKLFLPCTRSTSRQWLPPPPFLPSATPSSQTKEEAPCMQQQPWRRDWPTRRRRVCWFGGIARLRRSHRSASCVWTREHDAVLHAATGDAGNQEVDLLVPETPPFQWLVVSTSKVAASRFPLPPCFGRAPDSTVRMRFRTSKWSDSSFFMPPGFRHGWQGQPGASPERVVAPAP
jgi:hypothetical protein